MMSIKKDANGNWDMDIRSGNGTPPAGMEDAAYDNDLGSMIEDLNLYIDESEAAGVQNQEVVAWALFEAIGQVLGDSPEATQIMRLGAAITAFVDENLKEGTVEQYDERSELTA